MQIIQDHREYNVVFIHSSLDDAGLSPYAFRIYCHIARRANRSNQAWPGIGSIAHKCGLSESTARRAIKELEDREMLIVKRCAGGNFTNIYNLTPESMWKDAPALPSTPVYETPHPFPTDTPPLSVGHPKVLHEGNPLFPELKNSGHERLEIPLFPEMARRDEVSPPARKRGRPPKPTDPRYQPFLKIWLDLYAERFLRPYNMGQMGRDGKHLNSLLAGDKTLTAERFSEVINSIWGLEVKKGEFAPNAIKIHDLTALCTRWNQIVGNIS